MQSRAYVRSAGRIAAVAGLLCGLWPGAVPTAEAAKPIKVFINNREIYFSGANPERVNGRVLVPMRPIFEGFGMNVDWNGPEQKITSTRGEQVIIMWIGRRHATVNDKRVTLDQPPLLMRARTMVPLRFIGESLNANVQWNQANQTIAISDPGANATMTATIKLPPQRGWRGVFTAPADGAELTELPDIRGEITAMSQAEPIRRLVLQLVRRVDGGFQYWDNSLSQWKDSAEMAAVTFDERGKTFLYQRGNLKFAQLPPGQYALHLFAVHRDYSNSTVATANFTVVP